MNNISCLLLRLILFAGLILPATIVKADTTVTIDGLKYTIDLFTETASVTGYSSSLPSDVTIPSTVTCSGREMTVTTIADQAFAYCTKLVSISIPATVTQVGTTFADGSGEGTSLPFYGCTSLKKVRFEDGAQSVSLGAAVYRYTSLSEGYGLFFSCPLEEVYIGRTITYEDLSYTNKYGLPAKMTVSSNPQYFGYSAFYNKSKLAKVTISSSVTGLPAYLFFNCSAIKTLNLPNSVESVGSHAFDGCSQLSSIEMGESLKTIGDYAFRKCPIITLNMPNSVESVGSYAFDGCSQLSSIEMGESLKTIGDYAFRECLIKTLKLPEYVKEIGSYAFCSCSYLSSIEMSDSLKTIGSYAFASTKLQELNFPNAVTSIGNAAFYGIPIQSLDIPSNCKVIGDSAFCNCTKLSTITLKSGLKTIGNAAFANCKPLESISIPGTVTKLGAPFYNSSATPTNLPFYGCTSLKSVRFEDGTEDISLGAAFKLSKTYSYGLFSSCPLEEIYIGRNLMYKGITYNSNNYSLASTPQYFGYSAIYNQPKLAKVTISSAVKSIPAYLFYQNSAITTTELPKVQDIGKGAFMECSKLTTLKFGTDLVTVGDSAFEGCKNVTKLTFPNSITTIGAGAFKDCSSVAEITVGSGLKTIGANAFRNCSSFTALVAPDNFTRMDSAAFYGCKKLTVAKLGKSLTAVPSQAFYDCIALSEIDIPATATSIGDNAFYNDSTLAVITMREGLKTIGSEVFWNNSGITKFTIPGTVTSIGTNCFYGCTNVTSLTFSDGVDTLKIDNANCSSKVINNKTTVTTCRSRKYDYFFDCPIRILYLGRNLEYKYSSSISIYDWNGIVFVNTSRPSSPFANSSTLRKITVGPKVTYIYNYLANGCAKLDKLVLGESLKTINDNAFANCVALSSVAFPASLTTIGRSAFANETTLTTTTFQEASHSLSIWSSAFYNCTKLTAVTFPGQLVSLGDSAYMACINLKDVTFNKNSEYTPGLAIGNYAFAQCYPINKLSFPGRLKSIGNYAFAACSYLTDLTFEDDGATLSVGSGGWDSSTSSYNQKIPLFSNSNLEKVYIGRNIKYTIPKYTSPVSEEYFSPFSSQHYLTDVTFSQAGTVTRCSDYLLYGVDNCKSLVLPESLKSIGNRAFSGMSALEGIVIPNNVTTIGEYAFAEGKKLLTAQLSTSCDSLRVGLFANCNTLQAMSIPSVVKSMGNHMFRNCKSLKSVTFEDGTDILSMGYGASQSEYGLFRDCPVETLYLGRWLSYNTDAASRSPFYAKKSLKNLTFGKNVKVVDKYMFSYCSGLESVYLTDSITSVGLWGFRGCTSLKTVRFSQNLSQVSDYGFSECTSLDNVKFPASMTSVADHSFSNCTSLRNLDLGSSLLVIGPSAFENDSTLEGIVIPETLYGLGVAAFKGCTSLPNVTIRSISSVGKQAFQGCTDLKWVSLSDKTQSLGEDCFDGCTGIEYVKSYATTPPEGLVNFPDEVVANGTLFIPEGDDVLDEYAYSPTWENWVNVKTLSDYVLVSALALDKSEASMKAQESTTLVATVGADNATNKEVVWKSANEEVATVSSEGVVTAVAVGETDIYAIAADGSTIKASCHITVNPTLAESITLNCSSLSVKKYHTASIAATVLPTATTNKKLVWKSSNTDVATVDAEGNINALLAGETTITASATDGSGQIAECVVTVTAPISGDSNDDDLVNVIDAVNTVNYILDKETNVFVFEAADVNIDGTISVSDVTGTTAIILSQDAATLKNSTSALLAQSNADDANASTLNLVQKDECSFAVALDNASQFVALQTDILLPVSAKKVTVALSDAVASTHMMSTAQIGNNTLRVVVYSLANNSFSTDEPVFTITSEKAIDVNNLTAMNSVASDAEARSYTLSTVCVSPTAVDGVSVNDNNSIRVEHNGIVINGEAGSEVAIYTVTGLLVDKIQLQAEAHRVSVPQGVYIVTINGQTTKITIK